MERDYLAEVRKAQVANTVIKATRMPFKVEFTDYYGLSNDVRKAFREVIGDEDALLSVLLAEFQDCYRYLALLYYRHSFSPFLRGKKEVTHSELRPHVLAMAKLFVADFVKYRQSLAHTFSVQDVGQITTELFSLGSADTLAPVIGKSPPKPFSQLMRVVRGRMHKALSTPEKSTTVKSSGATSELPVAKKTPMVSDVAIQTADLVQLGLSARARLSPPVRANPVIDEAVCADLEQIEAESLGIGRWNDDLPLFYRKQIERINLTAKEELSLIAQAQKGDHLALRKLCDANLRHVVYFAGRFNKKSRGRARFQLVDLVQQGNLGLIKGIYRFDLSKTIRLITYAGYYIRQEIRDFVFANNTEVPVSVKLQKRLKTLLRIAAALKEKLARDPSEAEIRAEFVLYRREIAKKRAVKKIEDDLKLKLDRNPSEEEVENEYKKLYESRLTKARTRDNGGYVSLTEIVNAVQMPVFIDQPADDGVASTPIAALTATAHHDAFLSQRLTAMRNMVAVYLDDHACLDQREKTILKKRFGLESNDEETLADIGRQMNVSRERARQLEQRALQKLRGQLSMDYGDDLPELLETLFQVAS